MSLRRFLCLSRSPPGRLQIFQEKHQEIFHKKLTGHFWTSYTRSPRIFNIGIHKLSCRGGTKKRIRLKDYFISFFFSIMQTYSLKQELMTDRVYPKLDLRVHMESVEKWNPFLHGRHGIFQNSKSSFRVLPYQIRHY